MRMAGLESSASKSGWWAAIVIAAGCVLANGAPVAAQVRVDPKLPSYKPVSGVSGTLKSIGSDTMNNLMTLWAEGFNKFYLGV